MSRRQRIIEWIVPSRRRARLHADALQGRATSAHLSDGERARIFRNRVKR